jgi:hypothetical protein
LLPPDYVFSILLKKPILSAHLLYERFILFSRPFIANPVERLRLSLDSGNPLSDYALGEQNEYADYSIQSKKVKEKGAGH